MTLCIASAKAADSESIEQAAHGAYVTAINSNNVDTLLAGTSRTHWEKTSIGFVVNGDWAFERHTYKSTDTDKKTGAVTTDTGKGINIFRRGSDGRWRVAIDGWSSDRPAGR